MRLRWLFIISIPLLLTACSRTQQDQNHQTGIFNILFVQPIDMLLHGLGYMYGENYGLAIITIVLIIRVFLLPFMILQVKNMHMMREKTKVVQPQLDILKENVKLADTQEAKIEANKTLMHTYKQYDINPLKNMIGCLPILIQLPILYGLIITLKFPSGGGIDSHPHFLWFNLTEPNLWISIIAAVIYFFQPLVNAIHYPKNQRKTHYVLMILSPIFITYISLQSASALGLYWTIGGLFLIIQMHFAHAHYGKLARSEAVKLQTKLKDQTHE
ncbi:membrane protein insertase YidC [Staphylococcus edaphicus]|uniref:Membrane insertase YidC/Oxa/ALB C-terminal domain-containing protein n=1 Tax=Staphylococcus edaphicus TaxID=1955013 RepID=A0A2C6WP50_9STAP|nr:membrane protein insertase YidC [Staphylococcus edaphicus]PHK49574.1 hypothetical protein BTJ66_07375 [Staphylococcus edaphicus]